MDLTGQVAVVTGGGSGIGRATALRLAQIGARVIAGDRDFPPETLARFQSAGIHPQECDVRSEQDVMRMVAHAAGQGQVSVLVNNAGIGLVRQIPDVTEAEWDACLGTNLKGAFFCCKHVIPLMRRGGGGSIINIASNAGLLPRAHDPVYSISKGALVALTKSLALCHAADRIRVNAICPGPVGDTRMMNADLEAAADPQALTRQMLQASPLADAFGRMITPEEIAEAVVYLASDAAMMLTGTSLALDGGKSVGVPPGFRKG